MDLSEQDEPRALFDADVYPHSISSNESSSVAQQVDDPKTGWRRRQGCRREELERVAEGQAGEATGGEEVDLAGPWREGGRRRRRDHA